MLYSLAALGFLIVLAFKDKWSNQACRCRPGDQCWPSDSRWAIFNSSVHGHLVQVRPVGWPCSTSAYDSSQCDEVVGNFHNSTWRVQHPGASQILNWEYWPSQQKSCFVLDGKVSNCAQGRVSPYSVRARSVEEVQQTVIFAKERSLRLAIRNTGHDLAGRSSAPQSLQLDTSGLKGITLVHDFLPQTPHGRDSRVESNGAAVTIGAGVLTGELYRAGEEHSFTVVGGGGSTVGVAGGFLQSGGLSVLSPLKGLGSDNVLELEAVTADGDRVVANRYQNQDLFWAIRGGGGGTFAVVTGMTLRTFPDFAATIARLNLYAPQADDRFWQAVKAVLKSLPRLNDAGNSAWLLLSPVTFTSNASFALEAYLLDTAIDSGLEVLATMQRALDTLRMTFNYTTEEFTSMASYLAVPKGLNQAGVAMLSASVLISRDLITESNGGPAAITTTLSQFQFNPGDVVSIDNMVGGKMMANKDPVGSAVHPSVRSSLLSLTLSRGLPFGPDWTAHAAVQTQLERVQIPALMKLEGGRMGSYSAYGYPYEKEFGKVFWGASYDRLLRIKQEWDKDSLFITRLGVGSEAWDEDGMCRKSGLLQYLQIPQAIQQSVNGLALSLRGVAL